MATIERFEDIKAWQEGRKLARLVYDLTREGPISKDFGMRDQIRRAAVSVSSNIAEGFERSGNREFANFLWIAKGSSGETASQLYTLLDVGYITQEQFQSVYECARHCSYLIYRLLLAMRNSSVKGERYK